MLAYDPVIQAADTNQPRQPSGAALGNFPSVQGEKVGTTTLRTEFRSALAGDVGRDVDPGLSALLQACGWNLSAAANDLLCLSDKYIFFNHLKVFSGYYNDTVCTALFKVSNAINLRIFPHDREKKEFQQFSLKDLK